MESSKPASKPPVGRRGHPKSTQQPQSSRQKASTSTHSASTASKGKPSDGGSSRPCPEHSFLTDVADVRQMEQGLLQLLDDFHSGKLQAFAGQDCTFEKMDQVREQQEKLARLHFDMDGMQEIQGQDSSEYREAANKRLEKLMDNLQELCGSIQNLQKDYPATTS